MPALYICEEKRYDRQCVVNFSPCPGEFLTMRRPPLTEPSPSLLPALEEALLGNPYTLEVRKRWNVLRAGDMPRSVAEWKRWWTALPTGAQQDDAVGLILCVGVSRTAPDESRPADLQEAARILPAEFMETCAELAARCMA